MKKNGPYTILSTREVYKNQWIQVREDEVIHPDGKKGIFGVITQHSGSSILPIDDERNVYLIKEFRYAMEDYSIEAISGGMEENEDLLLSAQRELKEEGGIEAKKWTYLGYVNPFTTLINSKNHMYVAQDLKIGKQHLEGSEVIKLMKVPFKEAYNWAMNGVITHTGSVVLILKAKQYLNL